MTNLNKKRCIRCRGAKKVYRIGKEGYTIVNTGGVEMDCPLCEGVGHIEIPEWFEKAKQESRDSSPAKKRGRPAKNLSKDLQDPSQLLKKDGDS